MSEGLMLKIRSYESFFVRHNLTTFQDEAVQEWRSCSQHPVSPGVQTHTQFRSCSPALAIFACFLMRRKFNQHQILQGHPQKRGKKVKIEVTDM